MSARIANEPAAFMSAPVDDPLFEALSEGVCVVDAERQVVRYNRRFLEVTGVPDDVLKPGERLAGALAWLSLHGEFASPAQREDIVAKYRAAGTEPFSYRRERRDGTFFEMRGRPLAEGGFILVAEDLTERRRAESALRASDARMRQAFAQATVAINICDADGRYLEANDAFCRMVGYSLAELRELSFETITHPDDLSPEKTLTADSFADDTETQVFEKRYVHRNGATIWAKLSVSLIRDEEGWPTNTIAIIEDVTAQKRAIEARRESETVLSRALEGMNEGFAIFGPDGKLAVMNRHFVEYFPNNGDWVRLGITFEEMVRGGIASGHFKLRPGEEENFLRERLATRARGEPSVFQTSQGRWIRAHDQSMPDGSYICTRTDVTTLMESTQALRDSEERFRSLANNLPGVVFTVELDPKSGQRRLTYLGDRLPTALGIDREAALRGEIGLVHAMPPEDARAYLAAMEKSAHELMPMAIDVRFIRGPSQQWTRIAATPRRLANGVVRWDGIGLDITEQRAAEEKLRQGFKMDALGQLTGGIAHDFNNVLTVMLGSAELLQDSVADASEDTRELVRNVLMAGAQGADLTRRLLAFARRQPLKPETLDVNRLMADLAPLLERALGSRIQVTLEPAASRCSAHVDRSQLENAILNLATNARDAMPNGGRVAIATALIALDAAEAARINGIGAGDYVRISVADQGSGMTPDVIARATEPFFTTKPEGKGTGLGLSMVYGFVRQSGGAMAIDSAPGTGTTVHLYLPRIAEEQAMAGTRARTQAAPGGHETILVVEDEAPVRDTLSRMLGNLGYRVTGAANGQEALSALSARDDIDLLFTGLAMPGGIDGRALAAAAVKQRPRLRVLYTSGNSHHSPDSPAPLDADTPLLEKPFTLDELARSVRRALSTV